MPKFEHTKAYKQVKCIKRYSTKVVGCLMDEVKMPPAGFKFITQTLSPRLYKYGIHQQFSMTMNDLVSVLDYLCQDYCIITEVTDDGNVHYHFWVVFRKQFSFPHYKETIKANSKFGFSMLSKNNYKKTTLQQQNDCFNYMKKDIEKTYGLIRSRSIVTNINDHNIDVNVQQDPTPELDLIIQ